MVWSFFLQSWQWGEFQENLGYPIIRLGIYKKNNLIGICQVIKIKAKRGNFLFLPHGPILAKSKVWNLEHLKSLIKQLRDHLINLAKIQIYNFIRIAPILENTLENQKIFKDLGFKTAPIYMHAETTWVLDLKKTEAGLPIL